MDESATLTQLRRGVVGPCVLAVLAHGPLYGLEIARALDSAGGLLASQGTLYPLLNRLHDEGLLSSRWEVADNERRRRYYELTDDGRAALTAFTGEWNQFSFLVSNLMKEAEVAHN